MQNKESQNQNNVTSDTSDTPGTNDSSETKNPEWINSELETIGELKKGTMSVQYPDGFSQDFDFLNQGNNLWLPARLHPGTAPNQFREWLQAHKTLTTSTDSGLSRRKSLLSYSGSNPHASTEDKTDADQNFLNRNNTISNPTSSSSIGT
ncbi:hypothetical protein BB560_000741 [Smittium megazygosporum]|uniref:Uncharacterized protein n=1 Tax=Smittium megazygosporum TaxID=133381 RepID=A0A2T9ZJK2_9FUNG|nr:hypothetical protein BB560_000741 [Smittium megazygosporum]